MLFNSYTFWLFYIFVFIIYWKLNHKNQNTLLMVASYVFYAGWDWRFLFLIMTSTLIDFILGEKIFRAKKQTKKKFYLIISICANLFILGFFKYYNFFAFELDSLFTNIGIPSMLPSLDIILPVGISFYTFQTMSYSIDIYRNQTKPINDLRDYALYVSFFPQLVAGPIERSTQLIPQVIQKRTWKDDYFLDGLYLVMYGLFMKIVIADNMAFIVNTIFFKDVSDLSGIEVLVGMYAFAFQIYGDFAGYSSVARGISKWLGFELMVNFNIPYLSKNPSEFWSRWHISLSSWFRDYVYIPLGGNRDSPVKTHFNLNITMFLSGLWHGAGWTYIIWGILHGLYLSVYRILKQLFDIDDDKYKAFKTVFSIFIMFHLTIIAWLFFRAESLSQALAFLFLMFTNFNITPFSIGLIFMILFYVLPFYLYEIWTEKKGLMAMPRKSLLIQVLFYSYIVIMLVLFPSPKAQEFIYFQF